MDWDTEMRSLAQWSWYLSCVSVARGRAGTLAASNPTSVTNLDIVMTGGTVDCRVTNKPHYLKTTSWEHLETPDKTIILILTKNIFTTHTLNKYYISYCQIFVIVDWAERVIVKITPQVSCIYLLFNRIILSSISSELIRGQEIALSKYFSST